MSQGPAKPRRSMTGSIASANLNASPTLEAKKSFSEISANVAQEHEGESFVLKKDVTPEDIDFNQLEEARYEITFSQ